MRNYKVSYLMPFAENPGAVPDKQVPGYFRHEAVLVADDSSAVVREIRNRSGVPLRVSEVRPLPAIFNRASRYYRIQFLQAINFNVQAGMSSGRALQYVIESETGVIRQRLSLGYNLLRGGSGFHASVQAMGMYDETTLAILESGERTGSMREALQAAIDFLQLRVNSVKAMFGAVSWTALDLVMAMAAIGGNRFGLLPTLERSGFKSYRVGETAKFQELLQMAYLVNNVLLAFSILLTGIFLFILYAYFVSSNEKTRLMVDRFLLRIPALKDALLHSAISATFMIAASILRGGGSFLLAADIASRGTRLSTVREYWRSAVARVYNGEQISSALLNPLITGSERIILVSHTDRAQLGTAFVSVSTSRDTQAASAAKRFSFLIFFASLVYSGSAVLITLWVVYLQNQQMMAAAQIL